MFVLLTYTIYQVNSYEAIWELPPHLIDQLNLRENRFVVLKCGSFSIYARVKKNLDYQNEPVMGLSQTVLNTLKIREGWALGVKCDAQGKFRLGPIIGILTFSHVMAKGKFKYYIPYAKKMAGKGLLFVFGPGDIGRKKKALTGYHYDTNSNTWNPGEFPFPDAVIDRIYPNNYEAHAQLEKLIGQNKIFNKKTLINKMDFFTALDKDDYLRRFIPETRLLQEPADLEHFLNTYRQVFLKPLKGMKGRGIVTITSEKGGLQCKYMSGKNPKIEKITQLQSILDILEKAGNGKRPYIVQAEITRMEYRNRPFDFRVMVAKDGLGNWTVPAILARLAEPGGFLTNVSAGANLILIKDLFKGISNKLPYSGKQFLDMISDLSIKAATVLDREYGPLGKLGMDLIVDPSGKPWLIEANGNPGIFRVSEMSEYPAWVNQMYDLPIAYSLYLAGFDNT